MEHWLPLYHQRLVTLLDYLPEAGVTLDYQALEARDARLETIADFHEARRQIEGGGDSGGWVYKRSEEHTSELQSLMRRSYAAFCLKKKTQRLDNPRYQPCTISLRYSLITSQH